MDNNQIYHEVWGELVINSQASTVQPFKFGNVILFHSARYMWKRRYPDTSSLKRWINTPVLVMINQTVQLNKCYVNWATNSIRKQTAMFPDDTYKLKNTIAFGKKTNIQLAPKINTTSNFYTIYRRWFVSIQFAAVSVCGRFGVWPFRSVAVPVWGRSGLWPFRSVAVSVCGRFGLWPFRFWPFRFVAVMTRNHRGDISIY